MDGQRESDAGVVTPDSYPGTVGVTRRAVTPGQTTRTNRRYWEWAAPGYQAEHGEFLGDADFVWCPEGLREAEAQLLGPLPGRSVLEVGCGAAQCSRWLAAAGARPVGVDISAAQLAQARRLDDATGLAVAVVQGDAQRLPFAPATFDLACSAFGALPFVADGAAVMAEVARVLRPGGRWVFSVTHPVRWCFPDDAGPAGLTVTGSYFDRTPYVELGADGAPTYVEHHRTLGDRVRELVAAGFALRALIEPEWPAGHDRPWGQWSPLRGRLVPGTAIFVCELPAG